MAISRYLDELGSFDINTANDGVDTDVATIAEDVIGEAVAGHLDAALTVGVEPVQLQFSLDHLFAKISISWLSIASE